MRDWANLKVEPSSYAMIRELGEELSVFDKDPITVLADGVHHIASLSRAGTLSEDETQELLTYLLAAFIAGEVDTMLPALLNNLVEPFGGKWHWPTPARLHGRGIGGPTAGLAYP